MAKERMLAGKKSDPVAKLPQGQNGPSRDQAGKAVQMMLEDEEWAKWSDREISKRCSVSQPFVSGIRKEPSDNGYQMRTCQRGPNTYEIDTSNIGRLAETGRQGTIGT